MRDNIHLLIRNSISRTDKFAKNSQQYDNKKVSVWLLCLRGDIRLHPKQKLYNFQYMLFLEFINIVF